MGCSVCAHSNQFDLTCLETQNLNDEQVALVFILGNTCWASESSQLKNYSKMKTSFAHLNLETEFSISIVFFLSQFFSNLVTQILKKKKNIYI